MRKREREFLLRLNDYELTELEQKVAKTGWSREAYIRSLINGTVPAQTPPIEYHKMIQLLRNIAGNMNQIAATANSVKLIDADAYNKNVQMLYGVLQEIQKAILLPKEMDKNGDHKNLDD